MRLVLAGHDYGAIENGWTLGMVIDLNEALDLQQEADRQATERAK